MKITLLITNFNSISQLIYVKLKDLGYLVDVIYAINDKQMVKEVEEFNPDIILCPFLKKYVPKEIFTKYPTFIFHPGPLWDKGAYSLDLAIKNSVKEWGITILKANEEYDSGDVYFTTNFKVTSNKKSSLYRIEVKNNFAIGLNALLNNLKNPNFKPIKQLNSNLHQRLTQKDRKINWQKDSTKEIIKKINFSDSFPGVLDEILGVKCYLFGAWEEENLRGAKPKEILAKRDGENKAKELFNNCLPISADYAKKIGLVDEVFEDEKYEKSLKEYCNNLIKNEDWFEEYLWQKSEFLEENESYIEECKNNELKTMYPEFWEKDSIFHKLRYEFVYKICPVKTPKRLNSNYEIEIHKFAPIIYE